MTGRGAKTKEELDAAVLEAAEAFVSYRNVFITDEGNALEQAVRARRAAMRPHKAAVLARICMDAFDNPAGPRDPMKNWAGCSASYKKLARERLAEILAAPDEET